MTARRPCPPARGSLVFFAILRDGAFYEPQPTLTG